MTDPRIKNLANDKPKKRWGWHSCAMLFTLQLILLAIWGLLFFSIGYAVAQDGWGFIFQSASIPDAVNPLAGPSVTLDNGVKVEVVRITKLTSQDRPGANIPSDRDLWQIRYRVTNGHFDSIRLHLCAEKIVDQSGNRFSCQSGEQYVSIEPTFSQENDLYYGLPFGTFNITVTLENKSLVIPLREFES